MVAVVVEAVVLYMAVVVVGSCLSSGVVMGVGLVEGHYFPTTEQVLQICLFLDCDLDYYLGLLMNENVVSDHDLVNDFDFYHDYDLYHVYVHYELDLWIVIENGHDHDHEMAIVLFLHHHPDSNDFSL